VLQVKKLLNLKNWRTVPEAARHLSIVFGEDVSEADVLRLALDGNLTLSVHFVNYAKARGGPVVPLQDARRISVPSLDNSETIEILKGVQIDFDQVVEFDKRLVELTGVWDLKMRRAERLDVEHQYQILTDGPSVELNWSRLSEQEIRVDKWSLCRD
jgi:hypothetical protein